MTEKASSKLSREEIAKQFQLPERKSKIASILKQDDQKYCVCRSTDTSRFMIACDSCEEWYHGDCIGILENDAKFIRQYFCVQCQDEDQTLVTQFKPGVKAEVEARIFSPTKKKRRDRQELADITSSSNRWNDTKVHHKKGKAKRKVVCGKCANCLRLQSCGQCGMCQRGRGDQCLRLRCLSAQSKDDTGRRKSASTKKIGREASRRRRRGSNDKKPTGEQLDKEAIRVRQCQGFECVLTARPKSKYCSDECGLQLATNRIFQPKMKKQTTKKINEKYVGKKIEKIQKYAAKGNTYLSNNLSRLTKLDLDYHNYFKRVQNVSRRNEEENKKNSKIGGEEILVKVEDDVDSKLSLYIEFADENFC